MTLGNNAFFLCLPRVVGSSRNARLPAESRVSWVQALRCNDPRTLALQMHHLRVWVHTVDWFSSGTEESCALTCRLGRETFIRDANFQLRGKEDGNPLMRTHKLVTDILRKFGFNVFGDRRSTKPLSMGNVHCCEGESNYLGQRKLTEPPHAVIARLVGGGVL